MHDIYEMIKQLIFIVIREEKTEKESMQLPDICDKFDKDNFEINK